MNKFKTTSDLFTSLMIYGEQILNVSDYMLMSYKNDIYIVSTNGADYFSKVSPAQMEMIVDDVQPFIIQQLCS